MLDGYLHWVIRWHRSVTVLAVLVCLGLGYGASRLTITNDMRAYFGPDNPQLAAFDALEATFIRQDTLYFLIVPRSGDVFTPRVLGLVAALTELGWQAPYSRRVDSLANYQHTRAVGDDLHVAELIDATRELDPAAVRRVRAVALSEPALRGTVVARDGSATGVNVFLTLPGDSAAANDEAMAWATEQLAEFRSRYPDVEIFLGGTAATNVALGEAVARDLSTLVALSYATIGLGLWLLLRHAGGVLATLCVVTLSVVATMGLFGWSGAVLSAVAGFVPSIVMTIAVADSVHVLSSYYYELRRRDDRHGAIAAAMRINAAPVLITSVTTIIGVLTLNFSDSPPYRALGNMVAAGVGLAYLLTMTFLPALLAWMPVRHPRRGERIEAFMGAFADAVIRHHRALLIGVGLVVVGLASQIPRNDLTEAWHEYFDRTFEVRGAIDAIDRHLGYLHIIRYSVSSGRENGVSDPDYLADLDRFAAWYEGQPEVTRVTSIADTVKRLNRNLHGDDPRWYRVPETSEEAAQFLLLYELSLPQGLGLDSTIDIARSTSQLLVYARRTDSEQLIRLDERVRAWARENIRTFELQPGTGIDMVFAHINHRNIRGLLKGMAVALVLISALLVLALRSVRLGVLSLLTNLAPAGLAYGTWALVHGRIDLSASVVMCMSLGIVVDDTVHFLSKYLRARREGAQSVADGMRYAFNTVGVALCVTTAVLVGGFSVLGASHFAPSVVTGSLLAMTLAYALVVDLLFMPPLLIVLDRWRSGH